jgi:phosphonate degradation associated HDIG domain protein
MPALIDSILQRFERYGGSAYVGEPVTLAEHMLQAADAAEKDGAEDDLVVAALLHDFGHLLHHLPENVAEQGIDTRHEDLGFHFLSQYFGDAVVQPIHLHVAAKRYLCAVDPAYLSQLSDASSLSLQLQGGPFTPEEADAFARLPHAEAAVRLRVYDDEAKIVGAVTPDLAHFRPVLERVLEGNGRVQP